jgi:hypothetical protein
MGPPRYLRPSKPPQIVQGVSRHLAAQNLIEHPCNKSALSLVVQALCTHDEGRFSGEVVWRLWRCAGEFLNGENSLHHEEAVGCRVQNLKAVPGVVDAEGGFEAELSVVKDFLRVNSTKSRTELHLLFRRREYHWAVEDTDKCLVVPKTVAKLEAIFLDEAT